MPGITFTLTPPGNSTSDRARVGTDASVTDGMKMPGSLDDLHFGVYPPAIDISTPPNPQIFNPQFSVANTSKTETVSLARAILLVPVTTNGTNLARNTDMVPNNITPGWSFKRTSSDQGYAGFELIPDDSKGVIPAGGSVAFVLTGVTVDTDAGTAVLQLEAKTSAGLWTPTCTIELTTPSTIPTITRYSVTPAEPQTLTTLQGQAVTVSWTTSGAAYCVIEDDQLNKWDNQPTSGAIAPAPSVGNSPVEHDPQGGRYYTRTFTLSAYAAGAMDSDQHSVPTAIQLPTISDFSVSPASLAVGQQATVTWSVANIDPSAGTITLSLTPTDGTGSYTLAIPPTQTSGSSVVTPTPQTTTTYQLAVDNGYGVSAPEPPSQQVICPLPAGWQEMQSLETLPINSSFAGPGPVGLAAFANSLWCWTSSPPGLYRTSDGASWTAVTPKPALPVLDGVVVADLGDGEKLWAFGGSPPFLASSSDGINWHTLPTPPYAARTLADYVADDGAIRVLGGQAPNNQGGTADVWSTRDGSTWTEIGNDFPGYAFFPSGHGTARFAGKLQTVGTDANNFLWGYSSSDGGKTWSQATTAIPQSSSDCFASLLPVGGVLLLLGVVDSGNPIPNTNQLAMVMDDAGAWSVSTDLSPPIWGGGVWSAAVYEGCLWLVAGMAGGATLAVFRLNQVLPGTAFTLTPSAGSASE